MVMSPLGLASAKSCTKLCRLLTKYGATLNDGANIPGMGFTTAENLGGDKETVALLARRRIIKKCAVCGAMAQDKNLKRCGKCHSVLLLQGTPGKRLGERWAQATMQAAQKAAEKG